VVCSRECEGMREGGHTWLHDGITADYSAAKEEQDAFNGTPIVNGYFKHRIKITGCSGAGILIRNRNVGKST